jgi:membrane-associated protease RseP (regulator of RpoE activity)
VSFSVALLNLIPFPPLDGARVLALLALLGGRGRGKGRRRGGGEGRYRWLIGGIGLLVVLNGLFTMLAMFG